MPSSVISSIAYDRTEKLLRVTFVSGHVYSYKNVPEPVYERMQQARSKGQFLNREIKPGFDFEKIR
jgi:hypothetical protein